MLHPPSASPPFRAEPTDQLGVPTACPLDRDDLRAFLRGYRGHPCGDCAFLNLRTTGSDGGRPSREDPHWWRIGVCLAPARPQPAIVLVAPLHGHARRGFGHREGGYEQRTGAKIV